MKPSVSFSRTDPARHHSDLDYEVLRQSLPADVVPAYDGLRLTVGQAG
jgi:hypothetical protein